MLTQDEARDCCLLRWNGESCIGAMFCSFFVAEYRCSGILHEEVNFDLKAERPDQGKTDGWTNER